MTDADKALWFQLDAHLSEREFQKKIQERQGYGTVMTSTRVDESAQHFYRKLGYQDCGGLLINIPGYEQPMEMFLSKALN